MGSCSSPLVVVALVALVTLWLTGAPEAVIIVVAPLLVIIGVDRHYHTGPTD
jgi:hypothetical protein